MFELIDGKNEAKKEYVPDNAGGGEEGRGNG